MDLRNFFGASKKAAPKKANKPVKQEAKKASPARRKPQPVAAPAKVKSESPQRRQSKKRSVRPPPRKPGAAVIDDSDDSDEEIVPVSVPVKPGLRAKADLVDVSDEEDSEVAAVAGATLSASPSAATPAASAPKRRRKLSPPRSNPPTPPPATSPGVTRLADVALPSAAELQEKRDTFAGLPPNSSPPLRGQKPPPPSGRRLCLQDVAFVLTGVCESMERSELSDLIQAHGGVVRTAVSGRTDFLIVGVVLEDGRAVERGSKYNAAEEKGVRMIDEDGLFALVQQLAEGGPSDRKTKPKAAKAKVSKPKPQPKPKAAAAGASAGRAAPASAAAPTLMWVDRWKPTAVSDLVGNKAQVERLRLWLQSWDDVHIKHTMTAGQAVRGALGRQNPSAKAALISGPPGIGKTTAAALVAKWCNRDVFELNASDARSKKILRAAVGDVTTTTVLFGGGKAGGAAQANGRVKRVIIMDEVDGMSQQDRGGNQELMGIIKSSKTPIICICNDRSKASVRSLANHCFDLRFQRPNKSTIATRVREIAAREGLQVEQRAAEALAESVGNDIRQVVHSLQMWSRRSKSMTFSDLRESQRIMDKDSMLRQTAFSALPDLFDTRRNDFKRRYSLFFVDYDLLPLMASQSYARAIASFPGESSLSKAQRCGSAADAFSMADIVSQSVRRRGMWSLLPTFAAMNVKACWYASGNAGQPEFPEWMGRNSARSKRSRLIGELDLHLSGKVTGGRTAVRLDYIPVLRSRIYRPLQERGKDGLEEVGPLLQEYGLGPSDVKEALAEVRLSFEPDPLKRLDTKTKTALTKSFASLDIRSQALGVMGTSTKRKKAARKPAADDEAGGGEDDDEDDEEKDDFDVSQFQKKKRGGAKKGNKKK